MFKGDIKEAAPIVERAMKELLLTVAERGRPGSDARAAVGVLLVRLEALLYDDAIGEPLARCFDLAREAGMSVHGLVNVYNRVSEETPGTLGGKLTKDTLLSFCCGTGARIIADMQFTSREDVERVKAKVNEMFLPVEETAADAMDSVTYIALVKLHAATTHFLIETARPLPRMLLFRFAAPLPTLHAAQRLYADAGRADELRAENKVVHPAFMRHTGRAMSA